MHENNEGFLLDRFEEDAISRQLSRQVWDTALSKGNKQGER